MLSDMISRIFGEWLAVLVMVLYVKYANSVDWSWMKQPIDAMIAMKNFDITFKFMSEEFA